MTAKVKRRRRYYSVRRAEAAQRHRAKVIDAARRLFLRDGFVATTIAGIARTAGVSPEMVYKVFGSKIGLVRTLRDEALAGAGPVHAERRSDRLQAAER